MTHIKEDSFGLYISIINYKARSYFYNKLKGFSIGPGQQVYLLSLRPGETIVQDNLARRLKVDKANVSRALKHLERSGYISRTPSTADKRAWVVSLTDEGIKIRQKIKAISKNWIEILKEPLSDYEWIILREGLKKIAESMDDLSAVAPGTST